MILADRPCAMGVWIPFFMWHNIFLPSARNVPADSRVVGVQILQINIVKDGKATHLAAALRGRHAGSEFKSHSARPIHLIITMITCNRMSRLSTKKGLREFIRGECTLGVNVWTVLRVLAHRCPLRRQGYVPNP